MRYVHRLVISLLLLLSAGLLGPATAQQSEHRIALVVGNGAYTSAPLQTPASDAGLIAQTLQAAGFDVVGARDLDQDSLRRAFRDFLDKATASGPDTVAVVYLSGYGLQFEGDNYFVPIDAKLDNSSDVPAQAIRVSDYGRPLSALKLKASIVILDAARPNHFAQSGPALAGGLALVEPEPGTLIAFNAAPGTVAPEGKGPYGAYAQALVEMMREGGLALNDVFDQTRLRVNELTKGAEVPWNASKVEAQFTFFVRAPDAPPPAVSPQRTAELRSRPIRDFGAREAYLAALERDTIGGYLDFIAAYPGDPMAKRVRAIVAARREAITWERTRRLDTPRAYWSYLRRYSRGPHAYDARRRLEYLAAALEPPPSFEVVEYDLPPPPPDEIVYVERPVIYFDDPDFGFAPPPPPPVIFLAPQPVYIIELPPPPPPVIAFVLPIPVYRPVPVWVRPPVYVAAPPPNNVIFHNLHNTVVVNNRTNAVTVTTPNGQTHTVKPTPAGPQGPGTKGVAVGPALPPSVANKAVPIQNQPHGQPGGPAGPTPGQPGKPAQPPLGKPLPGTTKGQPLPPAPGGPKGGVPPTNRPPTGLPPAPNPKGSPPGPKVNQPSPPQPNLAHPPQPGVRHPSPPPPNVGHPPPPNVRHPSPPPPNVGHPPPPNVRHPSPPPPNVGHPPPPPNVRRPLPPPNVRHPSPPPPNVRHPSPPPPNVGHPSPPPPNVGRPSLPPPHVARPSPPPPPATRQPPPAAPHPAPRPANCGGPGRPPCPR